MPTRQEREILAISPTLRNVWLLSRWPRFRPVIEMLKRTLLLIGLLQAAAPLPAAAPPPVVISSLPKLHSGVPAYPVPFMAVARTPYLIAPLAGKAIDIQTDFGLPGAASPDSWTRRSGRSAIRAIAISSNLDIAYDAEKLCLLVCVPYPVGRKTRANATEPSAPWPPTTSSRSSSTLATTRAARKDPSIASSAMRAECARSTATCPQIGQPHQPWRAGGEVRQHDVGPHGKLDGRRADPFPGPRRAAQGRRRVGVPGGDPLRRSEDHRRALAG